MGLSWGAKGGTTDHVGIRVSDDVHAALGHWETPRCWDVRRVL
jgi:hypothetical protein